MQNQRIGGAVWPIAGVGAGGGVGHHVCAQVFADDVDGGRLAVFEAFGIHARHLRAHRVCTATAGAEQANEAEDENSLLHGAILYGWRAKPACTS